MKKAFVTALLSALLCAAVGSGCIRYKGYRIPISEQRLRIEPHGWWPRDKERESPSTRVLPIDDGEPGSRGLAAAQ